MKLGTTGRTIVVGLALLLGPMLAGAQTTRTVLGGFGGYVSNEQLWQPDETTTAVGGVVLGGFVDAASPTSWFSIRAEGAWVQRGGDVSGQIGGQQVNGGVRTDYLTFSIRPRFSVSTGPVRVGVAVGPVLEHIVRSRRDPALAPVLLDESTPVFGFAAGLGVGAWLNDGWYAELEARMTEGIGDAYSGDFIAFRNRSFEVVARVGTHRWRR